MLSGTQLDTTQGALIRTGNDLDLAIEGPGYFAGEDCLRPCLHARRELSRLSAGATDHRRGRSCPGRQAGPITIVGEPVSISTDGTISVDGAIAGRLKIVEFAPGTAIASVGGIYYTAPAGTAVAAKNSQVRQGALESSNVNPVTSVIELITAQRDVETMRRVLSMFNGEMDKTAAQDLPRVS